MSTLRTTREQLHTYHELDAYLGAREVRPLPGRSSQMERLPDGAIGIRYHRAIVVQAFPDGYYILDSGGWRSVTTKARINQFSPARVYAKDYSWYLDGPNGEPIPFTDGIGVDARGRVVGGVR